MINSLKKLTNKGFFHIFFSNILVKAISFISSFLIVRLVTKSDYASFSYTDNIYNYILLFSGMGLSSAYLKFGSSDSLYDDAYFKLSFKIGMFIQFILSIITVIYYYYFPPYIKDAYSLMILLILYPALIYLLQLLQAYTRSKMMNKLFSKASIINALTLSLSTILFVVLLGIKGVVYAKYLSVFITILFLLNKICVLKVEKTKVVKELTFKKKLSYIKYGFYIMIAEFLSSVMPVNEIFLVNNILKNSEITANFRVASLLPAQLLIITNSIIIFLFPIIAREKNVDTIERIIKKYSILNFFLVIIIGSIGMVLTPYFMKYAYGPEYMNAIKLSYMLWIVRILNTSVRMLPMNLIPAFGDAKVNAYISFVSVLIHFILEYILILKIGIYGVFYASVIVYLGSAVAYRIYLKKELNKRRYS